VPCVWSSPPTQPIGRLLTAGINCDRKTAMVSAVGPAQGAVPHPARPHRPHSDGHERSGQGRRPATRPRVPAPLSSSHTRPRLSALSASPPRSLPPSPSSSHAPSPSSSSRASPSQPAHPLGGRRPAATPPQRGGLPRHLRQCRRHHCRETGRDRHVRRSVTRARGRHHPACPTWPPADGAAPCGVRTPSTTPVAPRTAAPSRRRWGPHGGVGRAPALPRGHGPPTPPTPFFVAAAPLAAASVSTAQRPTPAVAHCEAAHC